MQKEAWTYSITGTVLGAFGVLLRWLQCQIIFEEETHLAAKGAPISTLLVAFILVTAALLWWLSGRMGAERSSQEPEEALAAPPKVLSLLLILAGLAAGAGSAYMFLTEPSLFMRVTALLGLLSAPVLAMLPSLPKWGGFGSLLAVVPVLFFCFWLVLFYRWNASDPVVWDYGMRMLAIAGSLFAAYRLCGYMFYRIKARTTIFACALGLAGCLSVLMDDQGTATRLIFAGWAVGFACLCWLLVFNFGSGEEKETEQDLSPKK